MVALTEPFDIGSVDYVVAMDRTVIQDLGVNEPYRVVVVLRDGFRKVRHCESMAEAVTLAGAISRASDCPLDIELRSTQDLGDFSELKVRRLITLE